jgi:hypothetical protein
MAEFCDDLVYFWGLIDWAQLLEESTQLVTNAATEDAPERVSPVSRPYSLRP